jgi:hypothetical protein
MPDKEINNRLSAEDFYKQYYLKTQGIEAKPLVSLDYDIIKLMQEYASQFSTPSRAIPTEEEIKAAIKELGKKSTAPDRETPDWMKADIERGIRWALSYRPKEEVGGQQQQTNFDFYCDKCGKGFNSLDALSWHVTEPPCNQLK